MTLLTSYTCKGIVQPNTVQLCRSIGDTLSAERENSQITLI
jgi:hypothetical protein